VGMGMNLCLPATLYQKVPVYIWEHSIRHILYRVKVHYILSCCRENTQLSYVRIAKLQ